MSGKANTHQQRQVKAMPSTPQGLELLAIHNLLNPLPSGSNCNEATAKTRRSSPPLAKALAQFELPTPCPPPVTPLPSPTRAVTGRLQHQPIGLDLPNSFFGLASRTPRGIVRQIPCSFPSCTRLFATNYEMRSHMRTHTGERPFKCNVCNKGFTQSGGLVRHKRVHSGEKPYACPVPRCGRKFAESGHMRRHFRTHRFALEDKIA
eukprot:c12802_g1_i1.p1 GENE.c12802_g1_i1~~c12802_g1_i1.p1  ORF type:complete len:206 (+),score=19.08 c12802_g1_i1:164-781(+)